MRVGNIKCAFIMPHPPIIIPFIGRGDTEKASATISAMKEAASRIANEKPETVIVISPHGNVFDDYVFMMNERLLRGTFGKFGNYDYEVEFKNDIDLLGEIINICRINDFPAGILNTELRHQFNITDQLDHGALVPLYYISQEHSNFKVLHISISNLDRKNLLRFGTYIREAVTALGRNVAVIASGDLSHYLSDESPYGYRKEGPEFDIRFVDLLRRNKLEATGEIPASLAERAGQCGLKSFEILAGILSGEECDIEVMSYEGPFGIGYVVADMFRKKTDDPYVRLARDAIAHYFLTYSRLRDFRDIPAELTGKKGAVFVSLKKHGALRGCIGTLEPRKESIAHETVDNALSAAFHDPRFEPLKQEELAEVDISVDLLSEAEKITGKESLDPSRYGVIVSRGLRRGVLLPDLEGVDTPEEQISIALSKAGIRADEEYKLERFEVTRHK